LSLAIDPIRNTLLALLRQEGRALDEEDGEGAPYGVGHGILLTMVPCSVVWKLLGELNAG
jgi:hypothetical protein